MEMAAEIETIIEWKRQSAKLKLFSCKIKHILTVKLMSFGNFFFEKIPKTGEQSITHSKEIDSFLEILKFVNPN